MANWSPLLLTCTQVRIQCLLSETFPFVQQFFVPQCHSRFAHTFVVIRQATDGSALHLSRTSWDGQPLVTNKLLTSPSFPCLSGLTHCEKFLSGETKQGTKTRHFFVKVASQWLMWPELSYWFGGTFDVKAIQVLTLQTISLDINHL